MRASTRVLASLLLTLFLIGCSGPEMPASKSAEQRRAEAERLRGEPVKPYRPEGLATQDEEGAAEDTGSDVEEADQSPDEEKQIASTDPVVPPTEPPSDVDVEIDPETGMMSPLPQGDVDPDDLLLGEYELVDEHAILDGDTLKVKGLDATLRLLGIDTEEIYHKKENQKAAEWDFDQYCIDIRGNSPRPVKYGTPLGMEAMDWAVDFFDGHKTVRLEFDEIGRQKGVYGRYLVYVFVKKNGEWVNYNVEAVRAGMAPYFVKYGYSRRFHDDFVAAQKEAQAAKRGIWGDGQHYPDYDERLDWWIRRGNALVTYEAKYKGREDYFQLGLDSEWDRMADKVGETVTVFGTPGDAKLDKSPFIATLSHKRFLDFGIVAFERENLDALNLDAYDGEYIYVRGKLSRYRDKYQFKAKDVEKIWME